MTAEGKKYDTDKRDWSLLPWGAIEEVVKVLEFGAAKYGRENWKMVDRSRYLKALLRHVVDYARGERIDTESKLPTLAHVGANVLFLLHLDSASSVQSESESS